MTSESAELNIEQANADTITQHLLAQWPFNENAMRQLAIDRAREIKDYLMDEGGLDPQRIFLLSVQNLSEGSAEKPSTELQLNAG